MDIAGDLNNVSYVTLALIGDGGASPHDLVDMNRRGGQLYYSVAASRLYAEPKRLERLGYVSSEKRPGKTRERSFFTLTAEGPRGAPPLGARAARAAANPERRRSQAARGRHRRGRRAPPRDAAHAAGRSSRASRRSSTRAGAARGAAPPQELPAAHPRARKPARRGAARVARRRRARAPARQLTPFEDAARAAIDA